MALWSRLMVNNKSIGFIEIQRNDDEPLRPQRDTICGYTVRVRHDSKVTQAEVKHRYGDGALVLLEKALAAINAEEASRG